MSRYEGAWPVARWLRAAAVWLSARLFWYWRSVAVEVAHHLSPANGARGVVRKLI